MTIPTLRIFISSPGDVSEERVLASRVVARLQDELGSAVHLEAMLWEHEPLVAALGVQTQIQRPSECDIVVCILWARLGTRLAPDITRPDGSRYESGTAFEFEDAIEGFRAKGSPDLLVYRKTATPTLSLDNEEEVLHRLEQKRALEAFVGRWFADPVEGTVLAPLHTFATSAQFEEVLTLHLRKLILRRVPAAERPRRGAEASAISWHEGSPYRGLETFEPEHAAIFRGRTRAVGEVLRALRTQQAAGKGFVLVMGASGAGKSSLVRAGVLPLLTQPGVIEGVGLWRYTILRPAEAGHDLVTGLAAALLRPEALPELSADGTTLEQLATMLRGNPGGASLLIKGALSQAAASHARDQRLASQPESRLAIVVDQMEELFTLERFTPEDRLRFTEVLESLARSGRVLIVATLRSDLYHRTQELPPLVELKSGAGLYDLLPPDTGEIVQMIREPAQVAGLSFEVHPETGTTLDDELAVSAAQHPGNLPLLEFTLQTLYEQRSPTGELTWWAYDLMGGLEGAIACRAEEAFLALPPEIQARFGRIFRTLVTVGSGEDDVVGRRSAPLDQFVPGTSDRRFVDAFIAARLCATDRDSAGEPVVTLAHEALLRHWPRLLGWLTEDRELLRIKSRLEAATGRWLAEGRRADLLLPAGKPLEEARFYAASGGHLEDPEFDLLIASERHAGRMLGVRRAMVALLAVVTVLALFAAVTAWNLTGQTRDALGKAQDSRVESEARRLEGLAREGVLLGAQGRPTVGRAKLLEAMQGYPPGESPHWFSWALWDLNRRHTLPLVEYNVPEGHIRIALSPDGSEALVHHSENAYQLLDLSSGRTIRVFETGNTVRSGEFALGGSVVLSLCMDNGYRVFDTATGALLRSFNVGEPQVFRMAISYDGRFVAACSEELKDIRVWDIATGELVETYPPYAARSQGVAFSRDGRFIAATGREETETSIRIYERATGRLVRTFESVVRPVEFVIEFSPDGRRLITGDYSGFIHLWDVASGQHLKTLPQIPHPLDQLQWMPDGARVLALTRDGHVRLWDTESDTILRTWTGDPDAHRGFALDASAQHLLINSALGRITLWSLGGNPETVPLEQGVDIFNVALDSTGRRLYATHFADWLGEWDAVTGRLLRTMPLSSEEGISGLRIAPDDRSLVISNCPERAVSLVDIESWTMRSSPRREGGVDLAWLVDGGRRVILVEQVTTQETPARGNQLMALDASTFEPVWLLDEWPREERITTLAIEPGAERIALATLEGAIELRNSGTGALEYQWQAHDGLTNIVAFSPDGGRMVSGAWDRSFKVWNPAGWAEMERVLVPGSGFAGLAITPAHDLALTLGDGERTIRVWGLQSRGELLTLEAPAAGERFTLSPDGQMVVPWGRGRIEGWPIARAESMVGLAHRVKPAQATLREAPEDAASWAVLGEWYFYQGEWAWALEAFVRAKAGGIAIDPLLVARGHWQLDQRAEAAAAFREAIAATTDEGKQAYLTACLNAVEHPPVIPPSPPQNP